MFWVSLVLISLIESVLLDNCTIMVHRLPYILNVYNSVKVHLIVQFLLDNI
jgi:hypothetical protein